MSGFFPLILKVLSLKKKEKCWSGWLEKRSFKTVIFDFEKLWQNVYCFLIYKRKHPKRSKIIFIHESFQIFALTLEHELCSQVTRGYVRVFSRMDTSVLWGRWRGLPVGITWRLPALTQPPASGKRRTMISRSGDILYLHFGICLF